MKEVTHRFSVMGSSTFPLDMLRRDQCYPSSESEAELLTRHFQDLRIAGRTETAVIELEARKQRFWVPTEERWDSFGWKVLDHRTVES